MIQAFWSSSVPPPGAAPRPVPVVNILQPLLSFYREQTNGWEFDPVVQCESSELGHNKFDDFL